MHILDLPQDTFSEIFDFLYKPPSRYPVVRIHEFGNKTSIAQPYFWQKGDNEIIYNLSLVCRALAEYTSPLRRHIRQQLINASLGMLETLSQDESLRQSIRYLTGTLDNLPVPSPSPLLKLFVLDINQPFVGVKLLNWIASCVNIRHLTLRALMFDEVMVPALADLQLWSLHICLEDNARDDFLPIQSIFSGQSRNSLQKLIIDAEHMRLSTLLPPATIFPRLRSLYLVNIRYASLGFANLPQSIPNLDTLVANLDRLGSVDFNEPGCWPNLKRVHINYSYDYTPKDKLLINAPSLSECVLQGAYSFFPTFHRWFPPCDLSNIRFLALNFRRDFSHLPSIDTLRGLAHSLVHLEVFILTLTSISRAFDDRRVWDKVEFMDADADSIATALKGFRSLRVLEWGVDIPSFGDAVDFLSPEWIVRHTPLYENLIVSIANGCPRLAEVKWAMSGEKRWVAEKLVREDDGSVSTMDFRLSEYNFLDRYADNFPVFTTLP